MLAQLAELTRRHTLYQHTVSLWCETPCSGSLNQGAAPHRYQWRVSQESVGSAAYALRPQALRACSAPPALLDSSTYPRYWWEDSESFPSFPSSFFPIFPRGL